MKHMIKTILKQTTVIEILADGIVSIILQVQGLVKENRDNRGVMLTLPMSGDVGPYRLLARIPNISKHISSTLRSLVRVIENAPAIQRRNHRN